MMGKQRILIEHTESLKGTMFNKAKNRMLTSFRNLTVCSLLHVKFKNENSLGFRNSLGRFSYSGESITSGIFNQMFV